MIYPEQTLIVTMTSVLVFRAQLGTTGPNGGTAELMTGSGVVPNRVALNFANPGYNGHTIGLPRAGQWRVRFNSDDLRQAGADQRRTGGLESGPGS